MTEREWLLAIRQILLNAVDLIERKLGLPRTSVLRRLQNQQQAIAAEEE
jgi:hypothetical protein